MDSEIKIHGSWLLTDTSDPVIRKVLELIQEDSRPALAADANAFVEVNWRIRHVTPSELEDKDEFLPIQTAGRSEILQ